jgi:hypothetical protein
MTAPSRFVRLPDRNAAVAAVPGSKSPCPVLSPFVFFAIRHQVRYRDSGGERCNCSERRAAAHDFIRLTGWHRRDTFREIAPVNAAGRFSFLAWKLGPPRPKARATGGAIDIGCIDAPVVRISSDGNWPGTKCHTKFHFDLMEGALNDVDKARRDAIRLAEQGKMLQKTSKRQPCGR